MKVVATGMHEETLRQTEAELKRKGAEVLVVRTDVSKMEDVEALAQRTLDAFGQVHCLLNNAGVGAEIAASWESPIEDWRWVLNVNLWGVIHGIKVFLPLMIEQGNECHIINTASMASFLGGPALGIYKVSKHAVVALTETLYYELAVRKLNVSVSFLCPGNVRTNVLSSYRPQDKYAAHRGPITYDLEISKVLREGVTIGMDPAEVAAKTFEAIRLNKFYILTHPEAKPGIQARMEDILNECNPRFY